MQQVLIAAGLVAIAAVVAIVLRRRQATRLDAPTQPPGSVPAQLDRADFPQRDVPWLLAVFSSATCSTCADVVAKGRVAASREVAFFEAEYTAERALHQRYGIDAVPTTVLADADGVVRASFLGPVTATDLWAAIAEAREPGAAASC